MLTLVISKVERRKTLPKPFKYLPELIKGVPIPLVSNELGKALALDLPHDDKIIAMLLLRCWPMTFKYPDGESHGGVVCNLWVLAIHLHKVFSLREDAGGDSRTLNELQHQLLWRRALRVVSEEPDALVQTSAESSHLLYRAVHADAQQGGNP